VELGIHRNIILRFSEINFSIAQIGSGSAQQRSGKTDAKIGAIPRHSTFIKIVRGFLFKYERFAKF